ncbi:hypothetical protein KAR91_62015 [Candidatus Pacearchaeota archaeon]|nr:hypothetical protein [Candidatus Pacearchaeota archaeon]
MLTTKAHFEYFQNRIRYWYKQFKLSGWRLDFDHYDIGDNYARVRANTVGRVVSFELALEWSRPDIYPPNQANLDECARHEVIHLILGPVNNLMYARFVTRDEIGAAEETLVRHLEELL